MRSVSIEYAACIGYTMANCKTVVLSVPRKKQKLTDARTDRDICEENNIIIEGSSHLPVCRCVIYNAVESSRPGF
jgi:hypothetical protein